MQQALPATTAYAADSQIITGSDNATHNQQVTVSGSVKSTSGIAPEGTLEVELPTSMQFTVDQVGNFTGSTYTVTNRSKVGIDVSVASFSEGDKGGGITLLPMSEGNFESKTRDNVALQLSGNTQNSVDLANFMKTGVVAEETKLLTVKGEGGVGTITLNGKAGKQVSSARELTPLDQNGVQENFNLVFQIKKENK